MCPDWGLNRRPFCLQDSAQSIEPHQPGPSSLFSLKMLFHCISMVLNPVRPNALLKKKRFYIFIFREGEGGRKRGREISMCGCLLSAPYWPPGLQPRHMPWLGIEPATLWFTGRQSIHWSTAARAPLFFLISNSLWHPLYYPKMKFIYYITHTHNFTKVNIIP